MDGKTEDNNINLGKFLPLGAVVLLKNATKRVMITGFCSIRKDDPNDKKIYDYIGCAFPEGIMSTDQNLLFNNNVFNFILFSHLFLMLSLPFFI